MKWLEEYKKRQEQKWQNLLNKNYKIPNKYLNNEIFKEYNKEIIGKIPLEVGQELEKLYDPNYVICIHRTQIDFETQRKSIIDIFNNGLKNRNGNNYTYTITPCNYFPMVISQLVSAYKYRQNTCKGSIIMKIPKAYLGLKEGETKPIWFPTENGCNLLPEYIYGYVPCDNGTLTEIYHNPLYSDTHDYQNDGLLYDADCKNKENEWTK